MQPEEGKQVARSCIHAARPFGEEDHHGPKIGTLWPFLSEEPCLSLEAQSGHPQRSMIHNDIEQCHRVAGSEKLVDSKETHPIDELSGSWVSFEVLTFNVLVRPTDTVD